MGNAHHGRVRRVMSRGSVRGGSPCTTMQTAKLVIGPAIGPKEIRIDERPESFRCAAGRCRRADHEAELASESVSYASYVTSYTWHA